MPKLDWYKLPTDYHPLWHADYGGGIYSIANLSKYGGGIHFEIAIIPTDGELEILDRVDTLEEAQQIANNHINERYPNGN